MRNTITLTVTETRPDGAVLVHKDTVYDTCLSRSSASQCLIQSWIETSEYHAELAWHEQRAIERAGCEATMARADADGWIG